MHGNAWEDGLHALEVEKLPAQWNDQYTGHHRYPTIILEIVASKYLWFLQCFFCLSGSPNHINVLQRSHFSLGLKVVMHQLAN